MPMLPVGYSETCLRYVAKRVAIFILY